MTVPANNRAHIRRFVMQFFSDDELTNLCFEYFPFAYEEFTAGMQRSHKVRLLIEGCERRGKLPDLLAALQRERPQLYDDHFAQETAVPPSEPKPITRNPRQIFISHAHQDAEFAQRLAADLRAHGWEIWIAPDSIRPGEKWVEAINRGLAESGVFVLVLSEAAVNSRWVQSEANVVIGMEHRGEIRFLPLQLESAAAPPLWNEYQWIPFRDEYKIGLENLLTILQPDVMTQLRGRYRELQAAIDEKEWQTAQKAGRQIQEIYPNYRETDRLLHRARQEEEQEQIRLAEAERLYGDLQVVLGAERWQKALDLADQVQEVILNYRDVAHIAAQARRELKEKEEKEREQKRQARAESLYKQLREAVAAGKWDRVLGLANQIEKLVSDYRNVDELAAQARREQRKQEFLQPLLKLKELPAWGWVILILVPLASWGLWIAFGSEDSAQEEMAALTATTTAQMEVMEATETTSPTNTSEPTSTATRESTETATPEPTSTTTPSRSRTATATPTVDPSVPPPNAVLGDAWTRPTDGMTMVYVPKGSFLMGSSDEDFSVAVAECAVDLDEADCQSVFEDELPQHEVTLNSFWLDQTEVTNEQFATFLNERGNQIEGGVTWLDLNDPDVQIENDGDGFVPKLGFADYPVMNVSWFGAAAYCQWVGGALPTEAQWEYAARGNDSRIYPWGNQFDGTKANYCDENCDQGWADTEYNDGYGLTAPVGSYSPSGDSWVGGVDMAGNVWEWVADWYDAGYYESASSNNPIGPLSGEFKVLRGGSWYSALQFLRVMFRNTSTVDNHDDLFGFRCILLPN